MTEETKASAATEPVVEPAPAPEPIIETSPTPEQPTESLPENRNNGIEGMKMGESATAQPVEPLNSEPILEPPMAPESMPEPVIEAPPITPNPEPEPASQPESPTTPEPAPTPQVIASAFSINRARELLIKAREAIQFRKRKKLEKVMGLFLKKTEITNDDVQKLLYVSDATATRYLDQLEREGKIKRENAGKYLSYSRM